VGKSPGGRRARHAPAALPRLRHDRIAGGAARRERPRRRHRRQPRRGRQRAHPRPGRGAAAAAGREADLQAELEALFAAQNTSASPDLTTIPAAFLRVTVAV
jgi:hypothetical protein